MEVWYKQEQLYTLDLGSSRHLSWADCAGHISWTLANNTLHIAKMLADGELHIARLLINSAYMN